MIDTILIWTGIMMILAGVVALVSAVKKAPEGSEDETGFHLLRKERPLSRPPFAAGNARLRSKKKDLAHLKLPAA